MVLLCRELGSFLSRINRYAFISGGQHRKLRHTGYSYFMQTWIQTTLSGQECTWASRLFFNPSFFFSIEVRSTILLLIFHDAKETKKETLFRRSFSIKFRYITTVLTSDSFLEEDREQDLLSITKLILSE